LLPAVIEHFGAQSIAEVVERLHFEGLPRAVLHELSPLLFRVAAGGDEIAGKVVGQLIDEVSTMVSVTVRRLEMTTEAPAVVLGGGVLTGVGRAVIDEIDRRCVQVAPRAVVRVVDLAPVVGAALLGLDAIGAGLTAKTRLRATAGPAAGSVPPGVVGQDTDRLVNGSAPGDADSVEKRPERFGAS
jgi:N-acetylglucosamine kinase-like BadF-type ATPase